MAKIYKTTDKIPVKIGELVFEISPLSRIQKADIQALIMEGKLADAAFLSVKYAVKSVKGLKYGQGDYELEFDDNNNITEDSLDDLSNIEESTNLHIACISLINGIPKEFVDPDTGKKLKDVSFVENEVSKGKK